MFKAFFASSSETEARKTKANDSSATSPASASQVKPTASPSSSPIMDSLPLLPSRASSSAMAAWTIPPFPHPLPERRIGVLPTEHGLLVYPRSSTHVHHQHPSHHVKASTSAAPGRPLTRPYGSGDGFKVATIGASHAPSSSTSAAPVAATGALPSVTSLDVGFLIDWSKEAKITPLSPSAWSSILNQASSDEAPLECAGIIGLSRFFSSSYLFVITSSKLIGHYFHHTRPIYCCTGVLAIPLLHPEASQAIRAQLAKQDNPPPESSIDKDPSDLSSSHDESGSHSESDAESTESDYDDVKTPAAIPREPFFSSLPASRGSDTLRMPKSRPWLTRAARAVSDGRIETISESPDTQAKLADVSDHATDAGEVPEAIATTEPAEKVQTAENASTVAANPEEQWHAAKQAELEDKAVRETAKYWARGEFWFSYDFDLTTSLQSKRRALQKSARAEPAGGVRSAPPPLPTTHDSTSDHAAPHNLPSFPLLAEPYPNLPLWRRADRRFWHNEHMAKDLVHAGLHAFILPVMQGYLQTVNLPVGPYHESEAGEAAASVPTVRCQMMVISRRSKERAGLRYQRRGINEAGQVANFVETEQLVYVLRSRATAVSTHELVADALSFVQIRGSIPLYWSQSPFSLKPPPVLERTETENLEACRKHFGVQVERYGSVTCVNLAEQGGKEGSISKAYRAAAEKLRDENGAEGGGKAWDRKQLHYVDFDFHKECSGMRFENVAKLIAQMEPTLDEMQYYHHRGVDAAQADVKVLSTQTGVFRVSCLDCLDRTNVVQSAFARHVLTGQLAKLEIQVGAPAAASAASPATAGTATQ